MRTKRLKHDKVWKVQTRRHRRQGGAPKAGPGPFEIRQLLAACKNEVYEGNRKLPNYGRVVELVSRYEFDINCRYKTDGTPFGETGLSPLGVAAFYDQFKIVKFLFESFSNLNPNFHGYLGNTPLSCACNNIIKKSNDAMVSFLLTHGADPAVPDKISHKQPIHRAIEALDETKSINSVKLLVDYAASPDDCINAVDNENNTPLHYAVKYVKDMKTAKQIIVYLLSQNATPTIPNRYGNSPLHLACNAQRTWVISLLLNRLSSTNVNAVNDINNDGKTPLDIAVNLLYVNGVKELLKHSHIKIDPDHFSAIFRWDDQLIDRDFLQYNFIVEQNVHVFENKLVRYYQILALFIQYTWGHQSDPEFAHVYQEMLPKVCGLLRRLERDTSKEAMYLITAMYSVFFENESWLQRIRTKSLSQKRTKLQRVLECPVDAVSWASTQPEGQISSVIGETSSSSRRTVPIAKPIDPPRAVLYNDDPYD